MNQNGCVNSGNRNNIGAFATVPALLTVCVLSLSQHKHKTAFLSYQIYRLIFFEKIFYNGEQQWLWKCRSLCNTRLGFFTPVLPIFHLQIPIFSAEKKFF